MADFTTLKTDLEGDFITASDPDYDNAITRWALNARRKAGAVVFVKNNEDVSRSILFAKGANIEIAIRGGGHNSAGASSTEGGLVIDLSRHLNGVKIDAEKKLAYIDGGALWEQVDKAAIEHGLATVSGTVNHTGVGGLTLGGGIGWLSGKYGLVIDNLVQVTVVSADGCVRTASDTENSDLFFGIRGGGCNFGIVTQFVLQLYPQRRTVWAGCLVFSENKLEDLVKIMDAMWSKGLSEKESVMQVLSGEEKALSIMTLIFYNGTGAEGRENFKAFYDLGPVADYTREMPYEDLNAMQNPHVERGKGRTFKGVFQKRPDMPSIKEAALQVIALSNEEHKVSLIMEYYSLNKIESVPNGGCAYIRGGGANNFAVVTWEKDTPENTIHGRKIARQIAGIICKGQEAYLGSQNIGYGNYDQDGEMEGDCEAPTNKSEILFGVNYPRLQQLKKKYDPYNMFCKWFPITPAA